LKTQKTALNFSLFLLLFFSACARIPKTTHTEGEKIGVAFAPEDLLLDTISGSGERLLISCNDHRAQEKAPQGEIMQLDLSVTNPKAEILPRSGEPAGLDFHPHGIFLVKGQDTQTYLFIVSHDDAKKLHFIYKYKVLKSELVFVKKYNHALIKSPNSVAALPNGGFYVSNDLNKRTRRSDAFFKIKSGSVVYCDEGGNCEYAAKKVGYANGLEIYKQTKLLVGTTSENKVWAYDIAEGGKLGNKTKIAKARGGDNIRAHQNYAFVAAHLSLPKFYFHFKNPKKHSPSVIYQINMDNRQRRVAFADKGGLISAAATGVYYNGNIYIGQVFQPFLLKVPYKISD